MNTYETYGPNAGSATVSYPTNQAQETRVAGVPQALSGTDRALGGLSDSVHQLAQRLEAAGVLRPSQPQADRGKSAPSDARSVSSSLAEAIEAQTRGIYACSDIVGDLLRRLDL